MKTVALDAKTLAGMVGVSQLTAVTDSTGRVVGYFAPVMSPQEMAHRYLGLPDPEELRRTRDKVEKTYTTAEVKSHLASLGGPSEIGRPGIDLPHEHAE